MVTVKNVHLREGERGDFWSLELTGDAELVQSLNTGRFYATARRCFISSTLDESGARSLIGSKFSGSIVRQQTEAYDFKVPETGEVIQLAHRWDYTPEEGGEILPAPRGYMPRVETQELV
ncbi:MAG: hypothetical protein ABIY90_09650 [Puia sp.]